MKAVVLAGTAEESDLTRETGVKNKSFISLAGKAVLAYVLAILVQVEEISDIYVVGPEEDLKTLQGEYNFHIVPEEGSMTKNVYAPCKRGYLDGPFLLVSGDIPLITVEALEDFLNQCRPFEFDLYYSIIPKKVNEERYPSSRRTYLRLKEGTFTGGNIFVGRSEVLEDALPRVEEFIALRKYPVKIISKLGISFLVRFATRQLTLEHLISKFNKLFGIKGKAIITSFPEIGTDLDKPSDLVFFREQLGG